MPYFRAEPVQQSYPNIVSTGIFFSNTASFMNVLFSVFCAPKYTCFCNIFEDIFLQRYVSFETKVISIWTNLISLSLNFQILPCIHDTSPDLTVLSCISPWLIYFDKILSVESSSRWLGSLTTVLFWFFFWPYNSWHYIINSIIPEYRPNKKLCMNGDISYLLHIAVEITGNCIIAEYHSRNHEELRGEWQPGHCCFQISFHSWEVHNSGTWGAQLGWIS